MFAQKQNKTQESVQKRAASDGAGHARPAAIHEQIDASPAMVAQRKLAEDVNSSLRLTAQRQKMQGIANSVGQLVEHGSPVQARTAVPTLSNGGASAAPVQAKVIGADSLRQMQSFFGDSNFKKIVKLAQDYEALPIPENFVDVDVDEKSGDVATSGGDDLIILEDKFYDQVWSKAAEIRLAIADWDNETYDDRKSPDRIRRRMALDTLEHRVTAGFEKQYVKKTVNEKRQQQEAADKVAVAAKAKGDAEAKAKADAEAILAKKAAEEAAKAEVIRQQAAAEAKTKETAALASANRDGHNDFVKAASGKQSILANAASKDNEQSQSRWAEYGEIAAAEFRRERTDLIEHRVSYWDVQWEKVKSTVQGQDRAAWISAQIDTDAELKRQLEVQEAQSKIKLDYSKKWQSKWIGGGEKHEYVKAKLAKDPRRIQDDLSLIAAESRSALFLSTLAAKVGIIKKRGNSAELRKAMQTYYEVFRIENADWSERVGNETYFGAEFERFEEDVAQEKKAATPADISRLKKLMGQRDQIGSLLESIGSIRGPNDELIIPKNNARSILIVAEQFLPLKVRELYIQNAQNELEIAKQNNGAKFAEWLTEFNRGRNAST